MGCIICLIVQVSFPQALSFSQLSTSMKRIISKLAPIGSHNSHLPNDAPSNETNWRYLPEKCDNAQTQPVYLPLMPLSK